MRRILFLILAATSLSMQGQFLIDPTTNDFDYYRTLALKNPKLELPLTNHTFIGTDYTNDSLTWDIWQRPEMNVSSITVLNPRLGFQVNTKLNRSYNDGPVWNGKGLNFSTSFGIAGIVDLGKRSYISYTFYPTAYYAQNLSFHIPESPRGNNEFGYPFERIDWVERYGNGSVTKIHPGQSEVKFVYSNAAIGFSTQNMVWGPAYENPVLVSANAGGFPHAYIGTAKPAETKIGKIEFRTFWGAIYESNYFDTIPSNDRRYITGLTLGYSPSFIKGLTFGAHRIMYRVWDKNDMDIKDAITALTTFSPKRDEDVGGGRITNDFYDQMASVSMHWRFPEVGFEWYMEYARNDFPAHVPEFLRQPDRTRATVIGFNKLFELKSGKLLKIGYERTNLSANQTKDTNNSAHPSYYVHGIVPHGYTNDGQIIGASIGPAGNTDFFLANWYSDQGLFGIQAQRIRYNDDYTFRYFSGPISQGNPQYMADFEISLGLKYQRNLENFEVGGTLLYAYRYNWFFMPEAHINHFTIGLNVRYLLN